MLLTSFRIALKALGRHKLRTALTMLGMMIGVAAVITMVALGTGASNTVSENLRSAGTNLIRVDAGNFTRGGEESNIATGLGSATTLTMADAERLTSITGVKYVAAGVKLQGWVVAGTERQYTQILGTGVAFPLAYGWTASSGRFFGPADVSDQALAVVIGRTLRDRLFGEHVNVIGHEISIRDERFRIVGITPGANPNQAEMAFVPVTTLQRILGIRHIHTILVAAQQAGDVSRVAEAIRTTLRARHGEPNSSGSSGQLLGNQMPQGAALAPDDFTVKTQAAEELTKGLYTSVAAFVLANMPKVDQANLEEMTGTLNHARATMTALLAAIAAISLIVGGIGIMNIMLVSVTERTREIGIRRAVGARRRQVLLQFMVEAVTLSCSGGLIGILCGLIATTLVTWLLDWPTSVSAAPIALAFGISAGVGMFFGFYPARRASLLDPIAALRAE
jgi:ABC-type antimicrobial peptide transport system permease subunit